jgi:hypothetical protein
MALFVARQETTLTPVVAWERLTDWRRHARHVPLTTITVPTPAPNGVGTVFIAHTSIGPFGFDDPMEIVEWVEPDESRAGRCRLLKRGSVMLGWAELSVAFGPRGARASWTEDITVARLPRFVDPLTALSSRLLFTRVLGRLLRDPNPA